jgi:hypothetical protein
LLLLGLLVPPGHPKPLRTVASSGNPPFNDHSSRMQGDPPPRIFMALRLFGNELPKIRGIRKAQDVDTFLDECMRRFSAAQA